MEVCLVFAQTRQNRPPQTWRNGQCRLLRWMVSLEISSLCQCPKPASLSTCLPASITADHSHSTFRSEKPFGMPKTTPRSKNKNKRVSRRVSPETPTPGPKRMRAQLLLKNAPNTPSPPISTKTRPQSSGRESGPKSVLKTPHTNKKRVSFSDASDERMIHTGESTAYK